ncbi:Glutamine amidotransferase subunit PdxT protein [Marine Group I thaumarchaeote SCGC RSA3]|uniref:Pyridoxal 5'-phosphate synthase subunit PdxT n=5 Tax=Marine Group I TaxID=905826 RepID=A0A081RNR6_9ARCH|nr:Glutamine amidotransferase subunit PdxT protein [Marine Group I thaumarchaeote SCGC AAA799-N04]KFM15201.1 Glutamine amidotransferase subunit PdxT protein [Marine Group I thaumarchaeote SCGC AAA799-D11]KFM16480.1 Glutamine amidotransferase subunit PdxT protein [Marine Group I thaumarchaeote SCGC RSA3]
MSAKIGILAIQGDVAENVSSLVASIADLNQDATVHVVKTPEQISAMDGLVIPGGESTTIGQLSLVNGSQKVIKQKVESGMPVLGICAGMILLANNASDRVVGKTEQPLFDFLDIKLERNSFGRQRESFEANVSMDPIGISNYNGVFIRAPAISSASDDVEVLAKLNEKIVAIKKGNIIGTSFHPELTDDLAVHKYFVNLVKESKN